MQAIPGIHFQVSRKVSTKPDPIGAAATGRHVSRVSLGDWLSGYCDSRYSPSHTTADHACGVSVILEGYLTGIRGVTSLEGSGVRNVLEQYLDHGLEFLTRLRGSYTGLILDARNQQAYLFNDRRASRPIFIREDAHGMRAGPELATLARREPVLTAVDPVSICEFVIFASCYNERTLFDAIRKLPPGSVLSVTPDGRVSRTRYWQLDIDPNRSPGNEDDWVDQALEHMDRACSALRAVLEKPVLLLSGGGDSRALLASLLRTGKPVATVSYGTEAGDDAPIARQLAAATGSPFSYFHIPTDTLHTHFLDAALRSNGQSETVDTPNLGSFYDGLAEHHDGAFQGDKGFCGTPPSGHDDVLIVAGPIGLDRAKRFSDMLETRTRALATESIMHSLAAMREVGRNLHPVDLRDKIYYEQRMSNRQNGFSAMTLRQIEQVRPWLDEDFIDLQFALPPAMRIRKAIVRLMVDRANASLASIPYASKDSIPQANMYRQLIPRQPELAEFIHGQFGEHLDSRLAALFRPEELGRLINSMLAGGSYPVPSRIWWQSVPGSWRFTARRYEGDLIHPVSIVLRLMQINLLLGSFETSVR